MTVRTRLKPSCGRPWDFLPRQGDWYCTQCFTTFRDSLELWHHLKDALILGKRCKPEDIVFNCREHGVETA